MSLKPISHYERIHNYAHALPDVRVVTRPVVRLVSSKVFDEKSRRVITKFKKTTVVRSEEMKPYKVSDFFLENLLAIGASLDPTHLQASPHRAVTDMTRTLENIDVELSNND